MKKFFPLLFLVFLFVFSPAVNAQWHSPGYYAIRFSDKKNNSYTLSRPEDFLSQKALQRREQQGITVDSTDLPPSPVYVDSLERYGRVKYRSRWQNSALMTIDDSAAFLQIKKLPFVSEMSWLAPQTKARNIKSSSAAGNDSDIYTLGPEPRYGATRKQLELIGLPPLHQSGHDGSGILIAILDAGFYKADKMEALSPLRSRRGIVAQRDFVVPGNSVYKENSHGQMVLCTMAALMPGKYIGSAPGADFLLLRTEDVHSEYPVEEYYWLAGAEYADSAGADIITSSLSYNQFDDSTLNHTKAMLNGLSTIVSRAATMAAAKGMLVFTSAGNEGNHPWRKIGFPADARGIIAVGATDTAGDYATLSSQGYSADGRVKPELAAVGKNAALLSSSGKVFYGNGTSFSTPVLAGAAAVLMQANRNLTTKECRNALLQSGKKYNRPDSLTGYGIPDIFIANMILHQFPDTTKPYELQFKVLPNPFQQGFYFMAWPVDSQKILLEIFDITGKKLWSTQTTLTAHTSSFYIDGLQNAANGIYFLRVTTPEKSWSRKIIKRE